MVWGVSGCDSQLISHSDEGIFPILSQKVSPRTAMLSETIHEKCFIGGLRSGLCSDNDVLKKKYILADWSKLCTDLPT